MSWEGKQQMKKKGRTSWNNLINIQYENFTVQHIDLHNYPFYCFDVSLWQWQNLVFLFHEDSDLVIKGRIMWTVLQKIRKKNNERISRVVLKHISANLKITASVKIKCSEKRINLLSCLCYFRFSPSTLFNSDMWKHILLHSGVPFNVLNSLLLTEQNNKESGQENKFRFCPFPSVFLFQNYTNCSVFFLSESITLSFNVY